MHWQCSKHRNASQGTQAAPVQDIFRLTVLATPSSRRAWPRRHACFNANKHKLANIY